MKVLVTGVAGQLGYDVMHELAKRGYKPIGSDILDKNDVNFEYEYYQLDITDRREVETVIAKISPEAVIHCAAWTAVGAAEDEENKSKVFAINTDGTRYVAESCKKHGCKMMYISTDYVFNGEGTELWKEDCKDFAPLNIYGETKLQGELAVSAILDKYFIVRTAWVFGKGYVTTNS